MAHQHINYSNIVLNFRNSEDSVCDVGIPDHCLLYIYSGEITFHEGEKKIVVREGECAFIRRDVRITMHKKSSPKTGYYQSILLKFTRKFLHDFYRKLESGTIPTEIKRSKTSIFKLKITPEVTSLFESIKPFFNSEVEPTEQWLHMKLIEGLYLVLNADKSVYASLFDFTDAWKIDILNFMNENYMYDLNLEELARYTGRSLTTFKRDFKKLSDLTPEKWIVRKRLEEAHYMLSHEHKKVKDVLMDVGFKNLSHFSRIYKKAYGCAPSMS